MKLLVWLFSVSALVLAALCIFVLVRYDIALLAAVSCLAVALIVSAAASIPSQEEGNARLNNMLSQRLGKNTNDIESLSRRIADQAQRLTDLGSRLDSRKAEQDPPDKAWPYPLAPAAQRQPKKPQPPAMRPSRNVPKRLTHAPIQRAQPVQLYLEPVVRLAEGRTAYYKASFRLRDQSPADLTHIVASADLPVVNGQSVLWDPSLDAQLLQQVLPLLEKLRSRRGATGIFCPISVATLENTTALQELVGLLQANPEGAAGIVLDIHHTALAGLSEAGLQGLHGKPACLIWGERDWCFTPAYRQGFQRRLPRARVHRAERAGHYVVEDAREEVLGWLEAFLADHPLAAPPPAKEAAR